ncbi:hypothetical protein [Cryobacterium sp. PAMC25264]|uniref:hypothetical protein n=1 Tax=Cryobacterium sp. PAMC25264 TaxID=2861288 RepID=UPI001C635004|nr:hypothetical protein [Cryobacterium sp. PAMC25264]QYF74882.1 hypothetical protein KY500_07035 [Cryobacterium sp. PAMC25264]
MNTDYAIPALLALMVLIGGPMYLIGKAVDRRRARKSVAWRASREGIQHHATVASLHRDSIGPLSFDEHEALLFNVLRMTSHQGAITWEGIIAQVAGARQMVRESPGILPWQSAGEPAEETTKPDPEIGVNLSVHESAEATASLSTETEIGPRAPRRH